ncbi:MAG: CoB--CoM heterodisulfide reductase iron-sulfur subunit A family protein, partial [Desulfobacteraceae bacterium]
MNKKYGVYICEGCGIGESLNIEKLSAVAEDEGYAVKTCPALCGKAGIELLQQEVAGGVNTLVLAACSPRVLYDTFRFDGCLVERVNLREQVVWSHPRATWPAPTEAQKDDESFIDHVQMLASDYLKMALAKVKKIELPTAFTLETLCRKILVIGGGITGISAALDAAKTGYEVTIVEKEPALGGNAAKWRKQLPTEYPYEKSMAPVIQAKIKELASFPNIQVKT